VRNNRQTKTDIASTRVPNPVVEPKKMFDQTKNTKNPPHFLEKSFPKFPRFPDD
jgi:hypothetical protein